MRSRFIAVRDPGRFRQQCAFGGLAVLIHGARPGWHFGNGIAVSTDWRTAPYQPMSTLQLWLAYQVDEHCALQDTLFNRPCIWSLTPPANFKPRSIHGLPTAGTDSCQYHEIALGDLSRRAITRCMLTIYDLADRRTADVSHTGQMILFLIIQLLASAEHHAVRMMVAWPRQLGAGVA